MEGWGFLVTLVGGAQAPHLEFKAVELLVVGLWKLKLEDLDVGDDARGCCALRYDCITHVHTLI